MLRFYSVGTCSSRVETRLGKQELGGVQDIVA